VAVAAGATLRGCAARGRLPLVSRDPRWIRRAATGGAPPLSWAVGGHAAAVARGGRAAPGLRRARRRIEELSRIPRELVPRIAAEWEMASRWPASAPDSSPAETRDVLRERLDGSLHSSRTGQVDRPNPWARSDGGEEGSIPRTFTITAYQLGRDFTVTCRDLGTRRSSRSSYVPHRGRAELWSSPASPGDRSGFGGYRGGAVGSTAQDLHRALKCSRSIDAP